MKLSQSRYDDKPIPWLDRALTETLQKIAAGLGNTDDNVDLIIVDDEYIRKINREYRGRDKPTDVISFSYLDESHLQREQDELIGEIYVSYETLEKEANTQGLQPQNLFLRIGVHGLLHVLGYDHHTEDATAAMEGEEKRLLLGHLGPTEVEELF